MSVKEVKKVEFKISEPTAVVSTKTPQEAVAPIVSEPKPYSAGETVSVKYQEVARPFDEKRAMVPDDARIEAKRKLAEIEEEEKKMVTGIFRYHECPKGNVSFPFKKYKGERIKTYSMNDGQVYTIPLAVARHLNTNTWYPVQSYDPKDASVTITEKVFRMGFQNRDF